MCCIFNGLHHLSIIKQQEGEGHILIFHVNVMAGTREILGSIPMVKIPTKSSSVCSSHFNSQQQNISSSVSSSSNSILVKVIRKAVATPMASTRIKSTINKASASETQLELEVKAMVTVKYDTGEYVKDMMFRWLDSEAHNAHKGVVLQLVSSQVDPSKHPRLHFNVLILSREIERKF